MAYLLAMGVGHLICQTFVKHQKQCNFWPGSLKMHPFLVIFLFAQPVSYICPMPYEACRQGMIFDIQPPVSHTFCVKEINDRHGD